jgi:hypothetical protein
VFGRRVGCAWLLQERLDFCAGSAQLLLERVQQHLATPFDFRDAREMVYSLGNHLVFAKDKFKQVFCLKAVTREHGILYLNPKLGTEKASK